MKKLKIVSIVVFILSVLLFGAYTLKEKTGKDQTRPVFAMDTDSVQVSVNDGGEALLEGITVTDAHDGDITDSLIVESVGPFDEEGNRVIRYAAIDSDNHIVHASRKLAYTDYTDPVFHLDRPLTFPVDTTDLLAGVSAQDCIDGDLTDSIQIIPNEDIDTSQAGVIGARLKVVNSAGGFSELPVSIEIYDNYVNSRLPRLSLKEYLVYLEKGESFNASDYLQSAVIDGTEYAFVQKNGTYGKADSDEKAESRTIDHSRVVTTGSVDTNTAGCYEIIYSLEDAVSGTGTGSVRMYVVVTEGGTK